MDETITITVMTVAKGLGVLVWWSVLFPMFSIPTVIRLWLGFRYGAIFGVLFAVISALALVVWSQIWPASFRECVMARMRSRWRSWWIYRHSWTVTCTLHGLTATLGVAFCRNRGQLWRAVLGDRGLVRGGRRDR